MSDLRKTGSYDRSPNTLIRESLAALHVRFDVMQSDIKELKTDTKCELQDLRTENLDEFRKLLTDQGAQNDRLSSIERKQLWVTAWAAGAAAILGGLLYVLSQIPSKAWGALAIALTNP